MNPSGVCIVNIKDYMNMNGLQRYLLQVELGVEKLPQREAHQIVLQSLRSVVKR